MEVPVAKWIRLCMPAACRDSFMHWHAVAVVTVAVRRSSLAAMQNSLRSLDHLDLMHCSLFLYKLAANAAKVLEETEFPVRLGQGCFSVRETPNNTTGKSIRCRQCSGFSVALQSFYT